VDVVPPTGAALREPYKKRAAGKSARHCALQVCRAAQALRRLEESFRKFCYAPPGCEKSANDDAHDVSQRALKCCMDHRFW
jgi:hypothetical protein